MGFSDITRESVLKAISEFDDLGRDEFLARYGFRRAHRYLLVHEGRYYDSKAIVGVAHAYAVPTEGPLRSGGGSVAATRTVQRLLERLAFFVEVDVPRTPSIRHRPMGRSLERRPPTLRLAQDRRRHHRHSQTRPSRPHHPDQIRDTPLAASQRAKCTAEADASAVHSC